LGFRLARHDGEWCPHALEIELHLTHREDGGRGRGVNVTAEPHLPEIESHIPEIESHIPEIESDGNVKSRV